MTFALILAAVALLPSPDVATDVVDLAEINHFYDERGKLVFDQIIFYHWDSQNGRYQVQAWRLLKVREQRPQRHGRYYESIWHDGDTTRRVQAKAFRESWTQYDPEMTERQHLPKHLRSELSRPILPGVTKP